MKKLAILLSIFAAVSVHAALISNFTDLRTELSDRLGVLSNSVDKVELKQAKGCVKGLKIIDKDPTLAGDIKSSYKLVKLLVKTFPDDFNTPNLATVTFTNNLVDLIIEGYNNIDAQLTGMLDDLQITINEFPEGKDRDQAQAAADDAAAALDVAFDQGPAYATKQFSSCLKSIVKAQKIIGPL